MQQEVKQAKQFHSYPLYAERVEYKFMCLLAVYYFDLLKQAFQTIVLLVLFKLNRTVANFYIQAHPQILNHKYVWKAVSISWKTVNINQKATYYAFRKYILIVPNVRFNRGISYRQKIKIFNLSTQKSKVYKR